MANVRLGAKAVGSIVKIKVNGAAKDFIIVHQGKPSSVYDDSCNGTWLLMKDIYEKRQWNRTNTNDYAGSTTHSYLNDNFYNLIDSEIRAAIKQVKIPYQKGTGWGALRQVKMVFPPKYFCCPAMKLAGRTMPFRKMAQSWTTSAAVLAAIVSVSHTTAATLTFGGFVLRIPSTEIPPGLS